MVEPDAGPPCPAWRRWAGLARVPVALAVLAGAGIAAGVGAAAGGPDRADRACLPPPAAAAHRGVPSLLPENTMPGFAAAVRSGARWLESDVRLTADGVPVLLHDATVDRTTTGSGEVSRLSAGTVRAVDAGVKTGPGFRGARVPVLAELLDLVAAADAGLFLELKRPGMTAAQVRVVTAQVRARGLAGRVVLISLDRGNLAAARAAAPEIPRGLLVPDASGEPAAARGLATWYLVGYRALTPAVAAAARGAGMRLAAWTVDEPAAWTGLARLRVDVIMTGQAPRYAAWLAGRCLS